MTVALADSLILRLRPIFHADVCVTCFPVLGFEIVGQSPCPVRYLFRAWVDPAPPRSPKVLQPAHRRHPRSFRGLVTAPIFNNLNNKQFIAYFMISGYGAGNVDDVRGGGGIKPARSAKRCKEARSERRFSTLKGQDRAGRSGPAGRTPRRAAIARLAPSATWRRVKRKAEFFLLRSAPTR
jgi:hypothetical protein